MQITGCSSTSGNLCFCSCYVTALCWLCLLQTLFCGLWTMTLACLSLCSAVFLVSRLTAWLCLLLLLVYDHSLVFDYILDIWPRPWFLQIALPTSERVPLQSPYRASKAILGPLLECLHRCWLQSGDYCYLLSDTSPMLLCALCPCLHSHRYADQSRKGKPSHHFGLQPRYMTGFYGSIHDSWFR